MQGTKITPRIKVLEYAERIEFHGTLVSYEKFRCILGLLDDSRVNRDPEHRLVYLDEVSVGGQPDTMNFKINVRLTRLVKGAVKIEINLGWLRAMKETASL